MKVSLSEAWAHAQKVLGADLKEVKVEYRQTKDGTPVLTWTIYTTGYDFGNGETFFEAVQGARIKLEAKNKPQVTDVEISDTKAELSGGTSPTAVHEEPKPIKDTDLPF